MAGIELKVKGLDSLLKKLNNYPEQIKEEVNGAIEKNVQQISLEQKSAAPVFIGGLRQGIGYQFIDGKWVLFSNAKYSPFIEFGTGGKVKVPSQLQSYAQQFRSGRNGTFKDFVRQLEIWVKRKGLDIDARFLAILILRNGIKPQPFFFEPFFRRRPQILADVRKAMKL